MATKDVLQTLFFGGIIGAMISALVAMLVYNSLPSTEKYINIPLSRRFRVIRKEEGIYYLESKFMGKWREVLWSSTIEDEMNTVAELKCAYRELREKKVGKKGMIVHTGRV